MNKPVNQNHRQKLLQTLRYPLLRILIAFFSFLSLSALAIEIQNNTLYQGGTQVKFSEIGVAVTIPQNWQGTLPAGSSFFFIESARLQTTMVLYAEQMSGDKLVKTMSQSIPLDEGINLIPKSAIKKEGDLLIADYHVPAKPELEARIIGRTRANGLSVALITLTSNSNPVQVWTVAKQTALNISFFQPRQSAKPTGGDGGWQDYMRGRYIARYYSGSNYHEKEEIWLCSNGDFYTAGDAGGYGGGASGAFANQGAGVWHATGELSSQGVLTLQYRSGGAQSNHALSLYNDKLYLNDTQWLRGANKYCQ